MKRLLFLSGFILLLGAAKAQPYIGLHFIGSSPQNMFCDSAYRNGFGFNMEFFSDNLTRNVIKPNAFDLRWGAGFDWQGAGREKHEVTMTNDEPGEMKINNSHLALTANLRMAFASQMRLSPYIDGFVAWRGFHTYQTLTLDQPDPDYETTTENRLLGRATFHYGASVGAMYRLGRVVSLDTRVTYSLGTATDWINLNTVQRETNNMTYRQSNTTTDLFMYRVGFVFRLNTQKDQQTPKEETENPVPPEQKQFQESDTTIKVIPEVPEKPEPEKREPEKKEKVRPTRPTQPKPAPTPKKPLEVKPTPPPAPKPKPQN